MWWHQSCKPGTTVNIRASRSKKHLPSNAATLLVHALLAEHAGNQEQNTRSQTESHCAELCLYSARSE